MIAASGIFRAIYARDGVTPMRADAGFQGHCVAYEAADQTIPA
jgi:hypothetical protein